MNDDDHKKKMVGNIIQEIGTSEGKLEDYPKKGIYEGPTIDYPKKGTYEIPPMDKENDRNSMMLIWIYISNLEEIPNKE